MTKPTLFATRSIELIRLIEFLRDLGAPVYSSLVDAGLPEDLEEHPDSYIATLPGCEWSGKCLDREAIEDFGWHAHKIFDKRRFNGSCLKDMNAKTTLHEQIEVLLRSMRDESNYHSNGIYYAQDEIRVLFPNPRSLTEIESRVCEWARVLDVLHVVRNAVGQSWMPEQIGFTAPGQPCDEARSAFGNTRFHGSQYATWVAIPNSYLPLPAKPLALAQTLERKMRSEEQDPRSDVLVAPLRSILTPYLSGGRPSIKFAASVAGVSARTLQRRLQEKGLTYSQLLDQCAVSLAKNLLDDPANRIADVALSLGYDDPSHFARSFRRVAGVSPTKYRLTG